MKEKNYTLTEKELFDLLESEINTAICGTAIHAMQEYNADSEMTSVLFKAFMKTVALSKELSPKIEEISDIFHKERINKETTE